MQDHAENWKGQKMMTALKVVWEVMNSPIGITAAILVMSWILNKMYSKKPLWKQYEGTIFAAIRKIEKAIPDSNKSLEKLDAALKYVCDVYEARTGKSATDAVKADFEEGIQIVHATVEDKK